MSLHNSPTVASEDPELIYELNPGSSGLGVRVNSLGIVGKDTPRAKPPGVFRLAIVGDSIILRGDAHLYHIAAK